MRTEDERDALRFQLRIWIAVLVVWVAILTVMFFLGGSAKAATTSPCTRNTAHPARCSIIAVVGHRAEEGPNENTIAALRVDRRNHVMFETDQWNLADGTPVIFHGYGPGGLHLGTQVDPASMPDGVTADSKPGDLTLAQWQQLRTYGGQPLPTLEQWINLAGLWQVPGMIEIKYAPVDPTQVAQWVSQAKAPVTFYGVPNVYRGVCHTTNTDGLHAAGMLVGRKESTACPSTLDEDASYGYSYVIGPASRFTTPAWTHHAHRVGLAVGEYDTDSHAVWRDLVNAKADYLIAPSVEDAKAWLSYEAVPPTGYGATEALVLRAGPSQDSLAGVEAEVDGFLTDALVACLEVGALPGSVDLTLRLLGTAREPKQTGEGFGGCFIEVQHGHQCMRYE